MCSQKLYLNSNKIGDAGLTSLSGALANGALAQLKELYLYDNQIGDAGVSALAGACASGAPRLGLRLWGTGVT